MRHTFWSCLVRCANMKWIRLVLWKIQIGHNFVHRLTDRRTDDVKPLYPAFNFVEAGGYNIVEFHSPTVILVGAGQAICSVQSTGFHTTIDPTHPRETDMLLAPGNPTLWSGVPVASIQKSFGSSGRDWKPGKKLPIPCKFFTCRFIRYSSTCYGMVRIDPLMANIRNPYFFASPVVNAARFVVVLPCYLNRDLLSGPKGN